MCLWNITTSAGWCAIRVWKIAFATRWHVKFVHKSIGMCGWVHLNRVWKLHFRPRWHRSATVCTHSIRHAKRTNLYAHVLALTLSSWLRLAVSWNLKREISSRKKSSSPFLTASDMRSSTGTPICGFTELDFPCADINFYRWLRREGGAGVGMRYVL